MELIVNSYYYLSYKTIELYNTYSKNIYHLLYLSLINLISSYLSDSIYLMNLYFLNAIYWIMLGVLATIGFGTGMYTGTFYLFPHLIAIKNQAEVCGNLDFNLIDFQCNSNEIVEYSNVSVLIKAAPPLMLWSFGTCLGELPPYYLAKWTKTNYRKYLNSSIMLKIKNNAFATILILGILPNFTFDMCGMASGVLDVNVLTFLSASFIGKGLIKGTVEAYTIMFIIDEHIDNFKNSSNLSIVFDGIFYATMVFFIYNCLKKMSNNYNLEYLQKN